MSPTDLVAGYDLHTDANELGTAAATEAPATFTAITIICVSVTVTIDVSC
ncbi:LxmA leader domain family RiPP [Actinoallomurus rhizosphaericola]|nr:LxmA leader domain family RiPP [Actinoallomurus rhizosphaericola]MCO5997877.1 LxmA leader domain family RiPP [Actinoallomurus rhizosphaericola]